MNAQTLSALLAAIVTFAIGWSVLLRERTRQAHIDFVALCFNLCLFYLATFLETALDSELFYFIALFAATAVPITGLSFFRAFLAAPERRTARRPRTLSLVAVGFVVALGYAIAFRRHGYHHQWFFLLPFVLYVFGGLAGSMAAIYSTYRSILSPVDKTRLVYLLVGGLASLLLSGTDLLPRLGVDFPPLGTVVTTVYLYFISQTLFRYRLLDLNELLGKMVVLAAFVVMLAATYGLLVAWVPPEQTGAFLFNTVVASFVILILFEPLRSQVEELVNRWVLRERYELGRLIDDLRRQLANVIDVREAIRLVLQGLDGSRRVTHAAIYLADQEGSAYELQGHFGPRPVERVDAAARRPFLARLTSAKGGAAVALEQLEREQGHGEDENLDAIARALAEIHGGVCVPILSGEQLLGLLALKDERLREAYGTGEIELFRGLAAQLGITLQNSKLYERMKERDRLAALGEMAAGLAHEIRNPLGSIKGAAQLLAPPTDDPKVPPETREFLGIIVDEVNRLNNVVSQFLDYARPWRGELQPLDLNEVVRKTEKLLPQDRAAVTLELDDQLPRVRGDAEQLRQVFLNLALNAIEAMTAGGRLTITSSLRRGRGGRGAAPPLVEVRFRDDGPGISAIDLKHLFIPFFTTKEKGTGLGLPISQRIVENHGGQIEVHSRLGQGSTFTVVLPVAEPSMAS